MSNNKFIPKKRKFENVSEEKTLNYNTKYRNGIEKHVFVVDQVHQVEYVFHGHHERFLNHIQELKPAAIVGCMYMFSESSILDHLAEMKLPLHVLVDASSKNWASAKLVKSSADAKPAKMNKKRYGAIKIRKAYDALTPYTTKCTAIQTLGVTKSKALMHHKFLVFLNKDGEPFALWNGSINFTHNSILNLENSTFTQDVTIANLFYNEWKQLCVHAKNLH
jgi:hypothetical protein